MPFLRHSWYLAVRDLRAMYRQPGFIAVTLVQPVIWLLLFGALFESVADVPGFDGDYIDYLAPGVLIMNALMSPGWSGMSTVQEIERGVMDRFLVSPLSRASLIAGRLVYCGVQVVVQSLVIVGLALAVGGSFGSVGGAVGLIAVAALLGAGFGALSNAMALVARQEETVIAFMQFLTLPLTFLSTAFMPSHLLPGWIADVAAYNPVEWAVSAGREVLGASIDWGETLAHVGLLSAFVLACGTLAIRAFGAYQRSI